MVIYYLIEDLALSQVEKAIRLHHYQMLYKTGESMINKEKNSKSIGLGIAFGTAVGAIVGQGIFNNLALGIGLGISLGAAIGAILGGVKR